MVRNIAGPRAGGHSRGGGRGEETGLEDERNGGRIPAATGGIIASRGGIQLIEQGKIIGAIGCSGGTDSPDGVVSKAGAAVVNQLPVRNR
jgi:uncharacterized protein GlcG (DUF336 family)